MTTRSERNSTTKWYKRWWVWLIGVILLVVLSIFLIPSEQPELSIDTKNITQSENGKAKFTFTTNAGNKYKIIRLSDNAVYGPKVAKSGTVNMTLYSSGLFKLVSYSDKERIAKKFIIHPYKSQNNESNTKDFQNDKSMSFGQSDMVGNSDIVAEITINSVQKVDPSDVSVVDVSSNYSGMEQYVIVNYTVKSIKGDIPLDDFDGSELSVADANGTIGTQSSNRDNGIPDILSENQNADLRIGVGLKHSGNDITVKFNDLTWKGQIQ